MKKVNVIFSLVLLIAVFVSSSAQAQERKRWSPQVKGTVIGAGTGAAAGAIIHKRNRVAGGVVGGVVGGATGYAIGKHADNKNKEEARIAAANRAAAERAAAANRAAANREAVATKKSSTPAREAVAVNNRNQVPVQGFNANSSAMMNNASANQLWAAGFLPNADYGDTSKPYYSSEYRRKSW